MAQTIFKTIILTPGESFTLPPDGQIIFTSDSNSLESECETPTSEAYRCYRLTFGISDVSGTDAALEDEYAQQHPTIKYIEISGTRYDIEQDLNNATISSIITNIQAVVPDAIFNIYGGFRNVLSSRVEYGIKFRTFPSLADSFEMKIVGAAFLDGLYLHATLDDDCNCYTITPDELYCNNENL